MSVLGVFAVIWPQISTVAVDVYVGWLFLVSGAVGLVAVFFTPTVSAFLWSLLTAALALFVGILLLWHPVEGAVSLTLVLSVFLLSKEFSRLPSSAGSAQPTGNVLMALAEADMSTGWIYGVLGVHPWLMGLIEDGWSTTDRTDERLVDEDVLTAGYPAAFRIDTAAAPRSAHLAYHSRLKSADDR